MPSFFTRLFGAAAPAREAKASRAAKLLAMHSIGQPQWTARNSAALTREGYERNAVGHRCVRMVAEAAASVPWLLYEGAGDVPDHPLLALIERPNPTDTCVSFIEAICANLLLYGNAYIESVLLDGQLRELYALRPDRMRVEPGRNGWPAAFVYRAQGEEARYVMQGEGIEPILHIRLFHPLDDYYGFSPLAAAQVALDTHNAASFWNKALLDNSARPSGALVYSGPDGAHLSDEQFTRLKQELEENFSGADNAGRPLLLEGGLDWRALSLSPKDMDFAESKAGAAREIALAFGVPPLLLGLPGDNTFANYSEANRAFWRQTVLPLVTRVQKSFQAWLQPGYGAFRLDYNADRLEALATERASEWDRIGKASFLTLDEQREAVGYGPAPKDGVFAKWGGGFERRYSPNQPRAPAGSAEGGQWTSGGGVTGSVSLLSDGEQPAFPWRGRITCDPAPGRTGSPDKTADAATQISSFAAGYRSFILHYANLCRNSGLDAFLIGSEFIGLTRVRSGAGQYPFVSALAGLAAEVKAILGASTKVSYAADWTEYGAHVPEAGEVRFPLDPLWASTAVDFIGVDAYPRERWRLGDNFLRQCGTHRRNHLAAVAPDPRPRRRGTSRCAEYACRFDGRAPE